MLWYNLGYIQFCLGDYKQAKLSFEESIKLNPEFQIAYKTISVIEKLRAYTMDLYS
jgi:tetratricopeptide (TPR) repeat protein